MEMRIIPCDKRGVPPPYHPADGQGQSVRFPCAQAHHDVSRGALRPRKVPWVRRAFFAALWREERGLQDGENQPL